MLPPVDSTTLSANPRFETLYRDLCTNKLNPDGSSVLDAKVQKERDIFATVSEDHSSLRSKARSLNDGTLQSDPVKDSSSRTFELNVDTLCTGLTDCQTRGSETQLDQVGTSSHQLR